MMCANKLVLSVCLVAGCLSVSLARAPADSAVAAAAADSKAAADEPAAAVAVVSRTNVTEPASANGTDFGLRDDLDPLEDEADVQEQFPFRDLPADVLRDFPGLCFGSTALRLFQVGQSWSLAPFCGVATCLVSSDGLHLVERVQDCGPQPKRNKQCRNVNARSEGQFPKCCPKFVCPPGVELEYPTQDELQQLAHEAAQAAVRAQYEGVDEEGIEQSPRVSQQTEEEPEEPAALAEPVEPVEPVEPEEPVAPAKDAKLAEDSKAEKITASEKEEKLKA